MKNFAIKDLESLFTLLDSVDEECYTNKLEILSGASVGQHVRHIIEFYIAVIEGTKTGVICYDNRKRDLQLETDKLFAMDKTKSIIAGFDSDYLDRVLTLQAGYDPDSATQVKLQTSLFRELGYCIEHSIHHQALIKVGLKFLIPDFVFDSKFGVAPATIRYRKEETAMIK